MKYIEQMRPCFGKEEKKAINEYMKTDGFITEFKQTEKFEQMIARYTGAKHCIVVNNGTISLTLAAMAVGIKAGDEVIVPNYTQIATPNSVKMFGAVPVFVDVEPETLCLDIKKVRQAITSKTRLIMFVSANGRYPKSGIEAFEDLVCKHKIFLIEDAAQCLGSFYPDGRHIGRAGLVGSFSFSTPKIISTGQGGALITDDDVIASKLRRLKDFGRSGGGNDIHDSIGYNFKFTELQACIGIEQIKKLTVRVKRKKEIWTRYFANLIDTTSIKLFDHNLKYTTPWFIDAIADNRQALINHLKARGIGTRVMYPPINKQKAYQIKGDYFVSYEIGDKGIWLPSAVQLKNSDIDRICKEINKFYK
jgi:perosamine synthetase